MGFSITVPTLMTLKNNFNRLHMKRVSNLLQNLRRPLRDFRCIHDTQAVRKAKKDISSEPIKFTSSPANTSSKLTPKDVNKYQPLIVIISLTVFMLYFLILREDNDIDEYLSTSIYDRVPGLKEASLAQTIHLMKARGLDSSKAEAELQELVNKRRTSQQQ